ncbi:motility protein B [Kordia sp. SMS9]|uniref:OmpA/MotB family protein n=1 Tax=Kordia sp. SMS9 TaxID=2282170 RepID=UPI000E0DDE9A|nr:OmpA family protein [Kordia sp. SMS9]AXG71093.1 motility protein B [Kordia sp. SMS9]
MKKILLLAATASIVLTSCVSKKDFVDLEANYKETKDLLNSATVKLNACLEEKASATAKAEAMEGQVADLRRANSDLKEANQGLIENTKDMTVLTTKGAENLEKSLESMKEKDLKITRLQDALNKKDSVTLAIVSSLKKAVGIDDPDIEINVEKGVVFISIADKLLFKSGSYNVTSRAKEVLAKVAKVVKSKPDFECMVEGHTDNVPYKKGDILLDNWDLSVKRSTAIIRVLQELGVDPGKLIAAGRSFYVPLVENDTPTNRAKNRRTRIVVLPKIDQFYDMIEKEMKNLSAEGK